MHANSKALESSLDVWQWNSREVEIISFNSPQQLHHGYQIAQQLRQINVLRLRCGQRNLCLQLATPDDWTAGVQDGIAVLGLGGAWIIAGGRAMSVSIKVGVGVHLGALSAFGVQHDSLRPRGLEVLEQVDYCVPV